MSGHVRWKTNGCVRSPTWHCQASIRKTGILGLFFMKKEQHLAALFVEQGRDMINDQNQKHVSWGITAFAVIAAALFFSFVLEHLGPITVFLGKLVDILTVSYTHLTLPTNREV